MNDVVCGVSVDRSNDKETRDKYGPNETLHYSGHLRGAQSIKVCAQRAGRGKQPPITHFPQTPAHRVSCHAYPVDVVAA
jgi:hypothetical protein